MKRFIKRALWRALRRDQIVLNPEWTVLARTANTAQVGSRRLLDVPYLPVRYDYHVSDSWDLKYAIQAAGPGRLRYAIGLPDAPPFCDSSFDVVLPDTVTVTRCPGGLSINGRSTPFLSGAVVPQDARLLVASLDFAASSGARLTRRMGHRVRQRAASGYGEEYFTGAVYDRYDSQALGIVPFVLDTIARHTPLSGRLLDIGCATGMLVSCAVERGMEAEGVDISAWAVGCANQRTGGRCRVLDIDAADASDFTPPYDIIVAHSLLEHVSDPKRVLGLILELCRPGGIAYVETLNADSLMHRMMGPDWCGYSDFTHKSPWITASWLEDAVRSIGFEIASFSRQGLWNDNTIDDAWRAFAGFVQMYPASVLLQDYFGDTVEAVLRRPRS